MNDESPRQIATPETLSRGDAMRAGSGWFGAYRADVAHQAGNPVMDGLYSGMNDLEKNYLVGEATFRSYDAAKTVQELPPASENPELPEQIWRMRVEMYARTTGIPVEEADIQLREDFKEYVRLLTGLLDEWRHRDLAASHCSMPADSFWAFGYFYLNRCGAGAEETMVELQRLHAADCCTTN